MNNAAGGRVIRIDDERKFIKKYESTYGNSLASQFTAIPVTRETLTSFILRIKGVCASFHIPIDAVHDEIREMRTSIKAIASKRLIAYDRGHTRAFRKIDGQWKNFDSRHNPKSGFPPTGNGVILLFENYEETVALRKALQNVRNASLPVRCSFALMFFYFHRKHALRLAFERAVKHFSKLPNQANRRVLSSLCSRVFAYKHAK